MFRTHWEKEAAGLAIGLAIKQTKAIAETIKSRSFYKKEVLADDDKSK